MPVKKIVNNCLQCQAYRPQASLHGLSTEGICIMGPPTVVNAYMSVYPKVCEDGPGCFQGIHKPAPKAKATKKKGAKC